MRELVKCIDCGTPFHYTMGRHYCDKCQKIGTPVNTFDNKRQSTNREIDKARGRRLDALNTANDIVFELMKSENMGSGTSILELVRALDRQIKAHS